MEQEKKVFTGATLYVDERVIPNGYLMVQGTKIVALGSCDELETTDAKEIALHQNWHLLPGMIDVHIHGAAGADVMDATPDALQTMAETLPREGTTAFLATTITQEPEAIDRALQNAAAFIHQQQEAGVAECVGIHLEGPFISKKHANAQPIQYIVPPDIEQFQRWQQLAEQQIRLVTLAPEEKGAEELIQHLRKTGVIASVGHSHATYAQIQKAIGHGLSHVTHLYNAMRGLHHREPGVVGSALLSPELMVEMIVDGIHSAPEMVKLAYQSIGSERLILITDAMRAKCLKQGIYDLGGQDVYVSDKDARLANGTLAGSILRMNQGVQNIMKFTGCSHAEIVRMTSTNAARELRLPYKGSLAVGKDADFVIFNEQGDIEFTYCRGQMAFERG